MQFLPYVKRTSRQQAHLIGQDGTRRIDWNSTGDGMRKVAKAVGGTMRRQRREAGFEHRTSGEGHRKSFFKMGSLNITPSYFAFSPEYRLGEIRNEAC
jgi:hypothetical protein